jgi:hypothetical protein
MDYRGQGGETPTKQLRRLMDNVMLDLETLDTRITGVIISIGAVWFDGNQLGAEFYGVLDIEDQYKYGRTLNPSTFKWWVNQSEAARDVFRHAPTKTSKVLEDFVDFLGKGNKWAKVWGNGSDFDNAMLGSLYETYGVQKPWSYSNNRCFRTLKSLAPKILKPNRVGTHHNALDDAKTQAEWANGIMTWLKTHG